MVFALFLKFVTFYFSNQCFVNLLKANAVDTRPLHSADMGKNVCLF